MWQQAKEKQVEIVIDATCPLVDKVHREVRKFAAQGYWIILIGHEKHDEIVGTSGEAPERIRIVADITDAKAVDIPDPDKVIVLTQTTLSVDDTREVIEVLKERFPRMVTPVKEDILLDATQNRQDAVKQLAEEVELILVIGSRSSENSNQLCKVARARGATAYLVEDYHAIDRKWLAGVERVGITSAPRPLNGWFRRPLNFSNNRVLKLVSSVLQKKIFILPFPPSSRQIRSADYKTKI